MANALLDATTALHKILEPLSAEDRRKAINAVLMLLGDAPIERSGNLVGVERSGEGETDIPSNLSKTAKAWAQKHKVSDELLSTYIHIDGTTATVIELPPAKSNRAKVVACYLMAGLAKLISDGEASFTDEAGRALCTHFGCYDSTNHSKYVKALGNNLTGSQAAGWKLTVPGLSTIANKLKGQDSSD